MSAGGFVAESERKKREEEEEKKAITITESGSTHQGKKSDDSDEGERAYSDADVNRIMRRTYGDQKKEPEEPASTERGLNIRDKFSAVREKLADTVKRRAPSDEELQGKIARLRLKAEMEEQKARVSDAKMKRRANMMKSISTVGRAITPRPSGKGIDPFRPQDSNPMAFWFGEDGGGSGMGMNFNVAEFERMSGFSGMGGSPTTSKKQGSDADFGKMMLGDVSGSDMGMGDMSGMGGGFSANIYNDIFVSGMGFGGGKPQKGKAGKKKSMEQEAHEFFGF